LFRCLRNKEVGTIRTVLFGRGISERERYMMACFVHCLIGGMLVASLYSRDEASILSEHGWDEPTLLV
jgi:hypothetical protein